MNILKEEIDNLFRVDFSKNIKQQAWDILFKIFLTIKDKCLIDRMRAENYQIQGINNPKDILEKTNQEEKIIKLLDELKRQIIIILNQNKIKKKKKYIPNCFDKQPKIKKCESNEKENIVTKKAISSSIIHVRPSLSFQRKFIDNYDFRKVEIFIKKDGEEIKADGIISLLSLGINKGEEVEIILKSNKSSFKDLNKKLTEICNFFKNCFQEEYLHSSLVC